MNKKKKLHLRGAYNLYNFGDDLLLISIIEFLNKELGFTSENIEIYIDRNWESLPELKFESKIKLEYGVDLSNIVNRINVKLKIFQIPLKIPHIYDIITNIFRERVSKKIRLSSFCLFVFLSLIICFDVILYKSFRKAFFIGGFLNFVENLDLIHYIGGGYFTDKWQFPLIYEFLTIFLAKTVNPSLKVIGTGLGLGPLKNNLNLIIFKLFVKKFNYLFVREHESLGLLEDLNINVYKKVLGDDVILLLPYLDKLKSKANMNNLNCSNITAFNLKAFPDHNYLLVKQNIENYMKLIKFQTNKIEFFCFGRKPGPDDHSLLEIFDKYYKDNLVIHDPYEQGWIIFLENLAKADAGLGFAYHFNVILTLLSIPAIGVYSGEYYKQKIAGVIKLLSEDSIVWSIDELAVKNLVEGLDFAKSLKQGHIEDRVEHLYQEMKLEYFSAYKSVLNNI